MRLKPILSLPVKVAVTVRHLWIRWDGIWMSGNNIGQFLKIIWEYDILLENNPYDRDTIAEIMELLLDTICSKRQYIRIAGDDKPREVVKSQFLKLNCTHIEYVLSSFKENASKVRNIKQYLLTTLYNAPVTMENHYAAQVNHDLYGQSSA